MRKYLGNKAAIALFTIPTLLIYSIVIFYPMLQTVFRSFFEWDGLNVPAFIKLDNYVKLFTSDDFIVSTKNSIIFSSVITVYQIGLGTIMALLLSSVTLRGRNFFKSSYFIPVLLSVTVVCQLWLSIYNGQYGLLNKVFEVFGMDYRQDWLSDSKVAMVAIAFVNAWQGMGYHMTIIYAGLKSIPSSYYEAAKIDGASPAQAHIRITLPLMAETYKICLILCLTFGFKAFEHMFIMTGGGPGNATFTMAMLLYKAVFRLQQYGYGCSVATVLVIQCIVVMLIINRFVARERISY